MSLDHFKSFAKAHIKKVILSFEVWLYTRVSSRDQESNRSLESQRDEGYKYAQAHNYNVTMQFGATYESASGDFTRKEFMKLIETVRKAKKKPFAILIYTMSRFSRSGGGGISLAHELVENLGVHLIEVATGKNTLTEEGKLEIYNGLIRASQDNIDRLKVTIPGMIKMLENGHWLGNPPPGYIHFGPKVKDPSRYAPTQRIEKGPDAVFIRRGWDMKLTGMGDHLIVARLSQMGYVITKQKLSEIWRNPFYCGVSANKLLNGRVVKGNWERMVTDCEFFKVQEILKGNPGKRPHELSNPRIPLSSFTYCTCGTKLTGYYTSTRGMYYYKCRICKGVSINADTTDRSKNVGAHKLFVDFLKKYELPAHLVPAYKAQAKKVYSQLSGEKIIDEDLVNREIIKLQSDLKNLHRKHALEGLDKEIYLEFKQELEQKINDLNLKNENTNLKSSNVEKCINISAELAQNLSKYWASGGMDLKLQLQKLVFPNGITLDTKNRGVRTEKVNMMFDITVSKQAHWETVNENSQVNFTWESPLVAGGRFELPTFGL